MKRGQMVTMRQDQFSLEKALALCDLIQPFALPSVSELQGVIAEL
jgi:hypothetical protein